jgi:endonuclease/exonuclease/phosphatase family metal-dependent hydrolase
MPTDPWLLASKLACMTANINGWMARKDTGRDSKLRRTQLLTVAKEHGVQVMGLQETHFNTEKERDSQTKWLAKQGYDMYAAISTGGTGSSVVLWDNKNWSLEEGYVLEPRLVIAKLKHKGGQRLVAISAPFHHREGQRKSQWVRLHSALE